MSYGNPTFTNRVGHLSRGIRWLRIAVLSALVFMTAVPSLSAQADLQAVDDDLVMVPVKALKQFQIDAVMILQQRDEAIQELKKAQEFLATSKNCS